MRIGSISKRIIWKPTLECNFTCSYCISNKNTDCSNFYTNDRFNIITEFIKNIIKEYDNNLLLHGGEPTIYPKYFDVLTKFNDCNITTLTNLSFNSEFLNKIIKYKNNSFIATYHSDFISEISFYNNMEFLYKNGINIELTLLFETNNVDVIKQKYYNLFINIRKNMPNIEISRTAINLNNSINIKEIDNLFGLDTKKRNRSHTTKHKCDIYKTRFLIDYNGDVYPCNINNQYALYNIFSNDGIKLHNIFKHTDVVCVKDSLCCN